MLAVLRAAANWLRDREDSYAPPFGGIRSRVALQDRKRSRILNDDELRGVWHAADAAGSYGALVKLLLLSGQRRDKVRTLRWSDVAPDGTWTIRTEKREKGNPGVLKLSKLALAIIARAAPRSGQPSHLRRQQGRSNSSSTARRPRSTRPAASAAGGFTTCDERRARLLSRAGVRPDIAERVLGHAVGDIEAIYDRHDYHEEKADALRKLAALIERIVTARRRQRRAVARDGGVMSRRKRNKLSADRALTLAVMREMLATFADVGGTPRTTTDAQTTHRRLVRRAGSKEEPARGNVARCGPDKHRPCTLAGSATSPQGWAAVAEGIRVGQRHTKGLWPAVRWLTVDDETVARHDSAVPPSDQDNETALTLS